MQSYKYPNEINFVLMGQIETGKTELVKCLSKSQIRMAKGTLYTQSKNIPVQVDLEKTQVKVTDTRGWVLDQSIGWSRLSQYLPVGKFFIFIAQNEKQSFQSAKIALKILMKKSQQINVKIKKNNIFVIFNKWDSYYIKGVKNQSIANKRQVFNYFFNQNIRVIELCLYRTKQNKQKIQKQVTQQIVSKMVLHDFLKKFSQQILNYKICILGTKDNKKNDVFQHLTNQKCSGQNEIEQKSSIIWQLQNKQILINFMVAPYLSHLQPDRWFSTYKYHELKYFIIVVDLQNQESISTTKQTIDLINNWTGKKFMVLGYNYKLKSTKSLDEMRNLFNLYQEDQNWLYFQVQTVEKQFSIHSANFFFEKIITDQLRDQVLKRNIALKRERERQESERRQREKIMLELRQREREREREREKNQRERLEQQRSGCQIY